MPNDDDYAVVVGISDYRGFDELPAAEGDALEFAKWLCDPAGGDIPPEQVKVIVTSDQLPLPGKKGIYPWKDHVDDALKDIIGNRIGRIGRRLYVYFSGHGCLPSYANVALLMANAEKGQMRNIGVYPYRDVLAGRAHFDEIVFFLDCCATPGDKVELGRPILTDDKHPSFPSVKTLVAVGAEMGQSSFAPNNASERSFFTKYLLEALRGAVPADGSITTVSLRDYVTKRVQAEALLAGKTQVPDIPDKPNIVFRAGGAPNQRLITFRMPREWDQPLELQDGTFAAIMRSNPGAHSLQAVLLPGVYQIVYPAGASRGGGKRLLLRVNVGSGGAQVQLDNERDSYDV